MILVRCFGSLFHQLLFWFSTWSISNFWLELIAVMSSKVCGRPRIMFFSTKSLKRLTNMDRKIFFFIIHYIWPLIWALWLYFGMVAMIDVLISRIITTESVHKINGFQTEPKASASKSSSPQHCLPSTAERNVKRDRGTPTQNFVELSSSLGPLGGHLWTVRIEVFISLDVFTWLWKRGYM